jgi:hypothetical protein
MNTEPAASARAAPSRPALTVKFSLLDGRAGPSRQYAVGSRQEFLARAGNTACFAPAYCQLPTRMVRDVLSRPGMRATAFLLTFLLATAALAQQTDDLIIPMSAAPHILIPAAGDVPGANGTHFRSDITILNLRDTAQRVQFSWLPQGSSGSGIAPITIDLPAKQGFSSENFAGNVMHQSGLGSIEISGVRQDNSFDSGAALHATARIWTPRPDGAGGTMSQTFPAIVLSSSDAQIKAVFGLRRGSQYRLNVGVSNPSTAPRRFRVTTVIVPEVGTPVQTQLDVDVAGRSMEQRVIDGTSEGLVQMLIEDITSPTVIGPWHAWGSSIDNESGDAWSQMAVPGS